MSVQKVGHVSLPDEGGGCCMFMFGLNETPGTFDFQSSFACSSWLFLTNSHQKANAHEVLFQINVLNSILNVFG
jgi:hypothetical protein